MPEKYENYEIPPGAMEIVEVSLAAIECSRMDLTGVTTTSLFSLDLITVPRGVLSPVARATFIVPRDELAQLRDAFNEALDLTP
jgi:hypothetical protein